MPKHSQLSLGPLPLANETQAEPARPQSTHEADALAADLFDGALLSADPPLSTADVAYRLDISESLVRRMRSRDARERVSYAQMLRLPPSFHLALHKLTDRHFGFGRAALRDLLDAAGRLAVVTP